MAARSGMADGARTLPCVRRAPGSSLLAPRCSLARPRRLRRLRRRRERRPAGVDRAPSSRAAASSSRAATTRRSARCAPTRPRARCSRRASRRCASARTASASRSSTSRASRSRPTPVALYVAQPDGTRPARPVRRAQGVAARQAAVPVAPDAGRPRRRRPFWVADVPFPQAAAATSSPRSRSSTASSSRRRSSRCAPARRAAPPDVGEHAISVAHRDARGRRRRPRRDRHAPPAARRAARHGLRRRARQEPVVLAFATPQLCQTRVCGPVVDVVAEVRAQTEGVEFIAPGDLRRQRASTRASGRRSRAWRLPTEPWTFVIDKDGKVAERFEGAVSVRELQARR